MKTDAGDHGFSRMGTDLKEQRTDYGKKQDGMGGLR
jgi:hypothetical protein